MDHNYCRQQTPSEPTSSAPTDLPRQSRKGNGKEKFYWSEIDYQKQAAKAIFEVNPNIETFNELTIEERLEVAKKLGMPHDIRCGKKTIEGLRIRWNTHKNIQIFYNQMKNGLRLKPTTTVTKVRDKAKCKRDKYNPKEVEEFENKYVRQVHMTRRVRLNPSRQSLDKYFNFGSEILPGDALPNIADMKAIFGPNHIDNQDLD